MEDNPATTTIYLEMEPHRWVIVNMSYLDRRNLVKATRPERRFIKDNIVHIAFPPSWEPEQ